MCLLKIFIQKNVKCKMCSIPGNISFPKIHLNLKHALLFQQTCPTKVKYIITDEELVELDKLDSIYTTNVKLRKTSLTRF